MIPPKRQSIYIKLFRTRHGSNQNRGYFPCVVAEKKAYFGRGGTRTENIPSHSVVVHVKRQLSPELDIFSIIGLGDLPDEVAPLRGTKLAGARLGILMRAREKSAGGPAR